MHITAPGAVRLVLELTVFRGGPAALSAAGLPLSALVSAIVLIVYHALAYDRTCWLLGRGRSLDHDILDQS
ncbi:hypothetical protein ACL02S_19495 [Nocardia sp. 004]|uniref:hypothetical protein n=1 Tax=Nocardia sp. 004 TaxID=3385978 RepID=UPI0039A2F16E